MPYGPFTPPKLRDHPSDLLQDAIMRESMKGEVMDHKLQLQADQLIRSEKRSDITGTNHANQVERKTKSKTIRQRFAFEKHAKTVLEESFQLEPLDMEDG
jgi:hypothetical protein